jgi:hypothetical protein
MPSEAGFCLQCASFALSFTISGQFGGTVDVQGDSISLQNGEDEKKLI